MPVDLEQYHFIDFYLDDILWSFRLVDRSNHHSEVLAMDDDVCTQAVRPPKKLIVRTRTPDFI